MRLRHKKTGDIIDSKEILTDEVIKDLFSKDFKYFNSKLDIIQRMWEDYEEPKEYYYISHLGNGMQAKDENTEFDIANKEMGNYFETQEEAERALEKLKAWKRLKDICQFSFNGIVTNSKGKLTGVKVTFDERPVTFNESEQACKDLSLLFGGEE